MKIEGIDVEERPVLIGTRDLPPYERVDDTEVLVRLVVTPVDALVRHGAEEEAIACLHRNALHDLGALVEQSQLQLALIGLTPRDISLLTRALSMFRLQLGMRLGPKLRQRYLEERNVVYSTSSAERDGAVAEAAVAGQQA